MTLSEKWQKLYKWYCRTFWILTVIGLFLAPVGGSVWDVRNEVIHTIARHLNWVLAVAALSHVNTALWVASLVVWLCRRDSAKGWSLVGHGVLTGVAGCVAFLIFAAGYSGA